MNEAATTSQTRTEIAKLVKEGWVRGENLISILQEVQGKIGYISEEAVAEMSKQLKVSEHEIYGVATFYSQFRFERPGRHSISVCKGTACFVLGADGILEALEEKLDIRAGHTTEDGEFSLDTVYCLGCCALSPVVSVDGEVHGNVKPKEIGKILDKYRNR
ncbi:MAG: NADH-quinone oxidoreductase subunit NuoE [Promethearchaeota archaeon]